MVTNCHADQAQCKRVTSVNKGKLARRYLFNQKHGNKASETHEQIELLSIFFFFMALVWAAQPAFHTHPTVTACSFVPLFLTAGPEKDSIYSMG